MDIPGHEGHNHRSFDPALLEKLMAEVAEAKVINNLFLIPLLDPPRFVMTQVDEDDGTITTLGYIPFDFMLDVGLGFISAVKNALALGMTLGGPPPEDTEAGEEGDGEEPPLVGGLFKVI